MRSSRRDFLRIVASTSASAVALASIRPAQAHAEDRAAGVVPGKSAAPVSLLVNGVSNPLAIDRDAVRFTWRQTDAERGAAQTAYRILVATTRELLAQGKGDLWDSGKMDSDKSAGVAYAGVALPAATRHWWKVRVWDEAGKPAPYSAPARFDTGLAQDEWTAKYIWDGTSNENNFAYFRKTFSVARKPSLAKVYVTAHNDYMLYLNGQLLGRGPARCDPNHYGQYNAYDVTELVKTGVNVFAAMAHWQGTFWDAGVNAQPAFLLEARLSNADAKSTVIVSDDSWKSLAHTAFIETDPTYFIGKYRNRAAIQFDARLEPKSWKSAEFDDSGWAAAAVVDRSSYRLFAQMAPVEREQGELDAVSVALINDAWRVDLERCIDGWPQLTMRANRPGDKVRVEYFEMTGERKASGWDEYTCQGGLETWKPGFGRHTSFQEMKITGYAGKLRAADVRGIWAYCDADVAGNFRCSSTLLSSIYKMCERSARQNIQQGIISVDANREQSPWLSDSWNIGNVLLYNHGGTTMIDKVVRDYAGEQKPDGGFNDCSPAGVFQCAEWSMYWPMLLWQQYLFSGDETLLKQMAPHLEKFLGWIKLTQDPTTKLLNPKTARISDYAGGNMPSGGYNVATACQYVENLRIASRIFSILGQADQSGQCAGEAEEVKAGVNANLFNGEFYLARTDNKEMFPLAQAWPLRFDIAPPEVRSRLLAAAETPGKLTLGGYGGDAFYSGLLHAGAGEFVVRDLERYRMMLDGNKANWEQFAGGEVNHAWTSYPGYIFLKYICGIQPTSGGFATFDIRPKTEGLAFAEGTVPTVKGSITTRWEKSEHGGLVLSIHVPANSRATVYLPKLVQGDSTIAESGKQLWPAKPETKIPGVLSVEAGDGFVACQVSAGDYRFSEIPAKA
ncbi:MAG: alpha-L-rhamnosidase N-terminal domain-containing protein [Terracidiphilus sp.]